MKTIKFLTISILFLIPFIALAEDTGCKDEDDCFPRASRHFGVTTGKVKKVVDKAKEGSHGGAVNAVREMEGTIGKLGWADKIKSSEKVGVPEHPWKNGRSDGNSQKDYKNDSRLAVAVSNIEQPDDVKEVSNLGDVAFEKFQGCFEPRLLKRRCFYCNPKWVRPFSDCILRDNRGFVWEYWWPEYTVDINNFGIASVNPNTSFDREDLLFKELLKNRKAALKLRLKIHIRRLSGYDKLARDGGSLIDETLDEVEDRSLMDDPIGGQSHFAGISPGDQTQNMEAHIYKTKVTTDNHTFPRDRVDHGGWGYWWRPCSSGCCIRCPYWWNGYIYKNNFRCHYDSIPDKPDKKGDWAAGWTEQGKYAPYWRFPELSGNVDKDGDSSEKYKASTPTNISFAETNDNIDLHKNYLKTKTCSSYRALKWPKIYRDLNTVFEIKPRYESTYYEDICYKGGGQLYPLTGNLTGYHHPLTSAALIARRAIELISAKTQDGTYVPRFTDVSSGTKNSIDKLQMVYPRYSKCFRMNPTVGNSEDLPVVEDTDDEFPADAIDPKQLGAIRFIFWNRRTTCSCQYRSTYEDTQSAGPPFLCDAKYGWGCQIFANEERGNGNESPKDKFYGSKKKKISDYAAAAWQLYFSDRFGQR